MPRPAKFDGWSLSGEYLDWSKKNLVLVNNPKKNDPKNLLCITIDEYDEYTETGLGPTAAKNVAKEIGDTYVVSYSRDSYKTLDEYTTTVVLDFNQSIINYLEDNEYKDLPKKVQEVYQNSVEEDKKILSDVAEKFPVFKSNKGGIVMTINEFYDLLKNGKYPKLFSYKSYVQELTVDGNYNPKISNSNATVDNTKKKREKSYRPVKLNGWSVSEKYLDWHKKNLVIVKNPENKDPNNLLRITKKEYNKYVKTGVGPVADKSANHDVCEDYVVYFSENAQEILGSYSDKSRVGLDFSRSIISYLENSEYKDLPKKVQEIYKDSDDKKILSDVAEKFPVFKGNKGGILMEVDEFYNLLKNGKYPKLFSFRSLVKELFIDEKYNPKSKSKSSKPELPMNLSELFD